MAASSHPVLQKFSLYQTKTRCYLVGRTKDESQWKVLKFSRLEPIVLEASEDPSTYTRHECTALLKQVDGGNAQHGGLQLVCEAAGVIGCFRFLEGFYLLLITKKRYQGSIRGQKVYGISETALVPLCHPGSQGGGFMHAGAAAERRYRKLLLSGMELTKDFFFSYDYDIARTLQANLTAPQAGVKFAGMFVWNEYLTRPLRQTLGNERWVLPLVHGFFQQRSLSVIGRHISITLIARRSKFFAGTRYRKRGVSDQGRVANDVETEQLVSAGYDRRTGQPLLSSVVQVRGSVPLYWTQEGSTLKPDILLQHYDPLYTATRLHFQDLVARYGQPITVLNLVRSQEKRPRETILRREFATAINYLNQQAGDSACIVYRPWDFNLHAKQRGSHILAAMHDVISQCLQETGFLTLSTGQLQHGVLRSNCIDCLDRTNVAQFAYGIMALGRQLHALGISDAPDLDARSSVARQLMDMYEAMGNVLARQYGGSEAHSTFFQRERGDWEAATQSRDLLTSIRRFYSNTYTDAEKQDAINIFLGNFVPVLGQPAVWDLDSDYYLHSGLRPLPAGATAGATSSGAPSPSAQSAQSCASAQSSPAQSSAAPLQPGRSAGSQPASPAQSSMGRSSPGVSQQEDRSLMDDASSPKAEAASDGGAATSLQASPDPSTQQAPAQDGTSSLQAGVVQTSTGSGMPAQLPAAASDHFELLVAENPETVTGTEPAAAAVLKVPPVDGGVPAASSDTNSSSREHGAGGAATHEAWEGQPPSAAGAAGRRSATLGAAASAQHSVASYAFDVAGSSDDGKPFSRDGTRMDLPDSSTVIASVLQSYGGAPEAGMLARAGDMVSTDQSSSDRPQPESADAGAGPSMHERPAAHDLHAACTAVSSSSTDHHNMCQQPASDDGASGNVNRSHLAPHATSGDIQRQGQQAGQHLHQHEPLQQRGAPALLELDSGPAVSNDPRQSASPAQSRAQDGAQESQAAQGLASLADRQRIGRDRPTTPAPHEAEAQGRVQEGISDQNLSALPDRQAGSSDRPPKRLKLKSFDKIIGKQPNTVHHVRLHAAPTQKPYLPQWLASPLGFRATDLPFGGHPQGSPLLRAPSMSSEVSAAAPPLRCSSSELELSPTSERSFAFDGLGPAGQTPDRGHIPFGARAGQPDARLAAAGHAQGQGLRRSGSAGARLSSWARWRQAPNTSEGLVVLDAPGGQPYPSASTAHLSHAERTSPSYQQSLAVEPSLSLRKTLSLDLAAIRPVHSAPQIASPPMNYPAFATERRKSPPGVKGLERSASATGPLVSLSSGPQAQARAPPRRRLTFPSMPLPFFLSKAPLTPQPRPTEPSILLPPRPATARDSTKPGSVQPKGSAAAAAADYQRRSQPPSIASFLGAATAVRAGLDDLGLPPCVQAWWSGAADPTDGWWEDEQLTLAAYQRFMGQVELQLHTTQQLELYAKYEALCSPSMHVSMGGFTDGVGSEWRQQAGLTGSRTFGEAELLNITGICG